MCKAQTLQRVPRFLETPQLPCVDRVSHTDDRPVTSVRYRYLSGSKSLQFPAPTGISCHSHSKMPPCFWDAWVWILWQVVTFASWFITQPEVSQFEKSYEKKSLFPHLEHQNVVSLRQIRCLGIPAADGHKWQVSSILIVRTNAQLWQIWPGVLSITVSLSKPTSTLPLLTTPVLDSKSQSWLNCKVFLWTHIFLWPLSTITLKLISNCNLAMFEHNSPVRKDEEHSPQNMSSLFLLFWKFWVMESAKNLDPHLPVGLHHC